MALSIAFFALAVTFISIGTTNINKARQMTSNSPATATEKKKLQKTGMLHFVSGTLFFIAGVASVL